MGEKMENCERNRKVYLKKYMIWLPRVCRRSGVKVNINRKTGKHGSGIDVSVEINIIINQWINQKRTQGSDCTWPSSPMLHSRELKQQNNPQIMFSVNHRIKCTTFIPKVHCAFCFYPSKREAERSLGKTTNSLSFFFILAYAFNKWRLPVERAENVSEVFKKLESIFLSSFTEGASHKLHFSIFKTTLED